MKQLGFTLIECVIALAVVAVLLSIAIPSYQSHINTSHQLKAQQELLHLANQLEQNYLENQTYQLTDTHLPDSKYYLFKINQADKNHFLISAESQLNTNNSCPILALNNLGQQGIITPSGNFVVNEKCWG